MAFLIKRSVWLLGRANDNPWIVFCPFPLEVICGFEKEMIEDIRYVDLTLSTSIKH